MIGYRGNPDGPTLSGEQIDPVHLVSTQQVRSHHKLEALCRTGAWNIVYTDDESEVTCPHCLERLKGKTTG